MKEFYPINESDSMTIPLNRFYDILFGFDMNWKMFKIHPYSHHETTLLEDNTIPSNLIQKESTKPSPTPSSDEIIDNSMKSVVCFDQISIPQKSPQ